MFWNQDINDFNGFSKQFVINILLLRKDTGSAIERVYNVYYLDVQNIWFSILQKQKMFIKSVVLQFTSSPHPRLILYT